MVCTAHFPGLHLPSEAVQFLNVIGRSDLEAVWVRGIHWKSGAREGLLTQEPLREWEQQGRGMYLVVNPGGTKDEHITTAVALFAEWDHRPINEQRAFDWDAAGIPAPSVIVWSGGGSLHLYWPLSKPCRDIWRWRLLIWRLIRLLDSDKAVENPSRLMRLPGFQYFYTPKKAQKLGLEPGALGGVARLEKCEDRQFTFEELEAAIAQAERRQGLNPYDAIPSSKRLRPEVVELVERMGLAPTPNSADETQKAQTVEAMYQQATGDYPADTLDDIKDALACIPPRIPGSGNYQEHRNLLWGLAAALEKSGYDRALAPILMAEHSPEWAKAESLERIAASTNGCISAGVFWQIARNYGYRRWRNRRQASSRSPFQDQSPAPTTPKSGHSEEAGPGLPDSIQIKQRPVEVELADQVFTPAHGFASDGQRLYQYNPERGYWIGLGEIEAKALVLHSLKRCWQYRKDSATKEHVVVWPYGTDRQINSTYNVILRNALQPGLRSTHRRYLAFIDRTLDLQTQTAVDHAPEHWATSAIDSPLILSEECPDNFRHFIETCYGSGLIEMIRAVIRWALDPSIPYEKAIFLLGNSGTGKGCLIEFIQSLFPTHLRQSLSNPDQLYNAEKIHQFVQGRSLLVFPDVTRPVADMSLTYCLIENASVPSRRLHCNETDQACLDVRVILASTRPLQLKDGSDGWHRRILTIPTQDRLGGVINTDLKDSLIGNSHDHARLRSAVIGWAMTMERQQAINLLRNGQELIPEMAEAQDRAEVEADPVANFIDRCLVPAPGLIIDTPLQMLIKHAYLAYCDSENYKRTWSGPQLWGTIRKNLSGSHIRRRSINGKSVSAVDVGYQLRHGLVIIATNGSVTICSSAMGQGGLQAIRASLPKHPKPQNINNHKPIQKETKISLPLPGQSIEAPLVQWNLTPEMPKQVRALAEKHSETTLDQFARILQTEGVDIDPLWVPELIHWVWYVTSREIT